MVFSEVEHLEDGNCGCPGGIPPPRAGPVASAQLIHGRVRLGTSRAPVRRAERPPPLPVHRYCRVQVRRSADGGGI